jgi:hypothetical protein
VDFALETITTKHSEAVRELAEHLDCKGDEKGMRMLDEILEYNVMLVQTLNDRLRKYYGDTRKQVHGAPATNGR